MQTLRWHLNTAVSSGEFYAWVVDGSGHWYDAAQSVAAVAGQTDYSTNWTVNAPVGSNYSLEVYYRATTGAGSWLASGTSAAGFSISQGMAITSPNGGESIAYGQKATMSWIFGSNATTGSFDVYVWSPTKGTVKLNSSPIAVDSSKTSYSFDWTVTQALSSDYKVRVWYRDAGGNVALADDSDATFAIAAPQPTVTAPNGGEQLPSGSPTSVTWTVPKALSVGSFDLQAVSPTQGTVDLTTSHIAADASKTSYSFTWMVALAAASDYKLHLIYDDGSGQPMATDDSDAAFTVVAPTMSKITVTAPAAGAHIGSGTPSAVTWNVDAAVGAGSFDVQAVSPTQGTTTLNSSHIAADGTKTSYSFAWNATQAAAADYTIHIVYHDAGGQALVTGDSGAFTIDPATALGLEAVGKYEYVAAGLAGLKIYDVSDPANPALVGACDTPGNAQSVKVQDGYAYVADGAAGMQVIDISDPTNPTIATTLATGAAAQGVALSSGALLEDFDATTGWSIDGGTMALDTTHVKHGAASLKVTAAPGTTATIVKTNLNWDLSKDARGIQMWVYLHSTGVSPDTSNDSLTLGLYLSNGNYLVNNFRAHNSVDVHEGWNLLHWNFADNNDDPDWVQSTPGAESWNQPIQQMALAVTAPADRGYEVSFDDFRVGVTGNRPAVLWTFDDGYDENYTDVFPYMQAHGENGTMFVIGDWPGSGGSKITLPHLHAMYDAGWAISNHTIDHTDLATVDEATAETKIQQGRDWLLSQGFTRAANFLAYPENDTSPSAVTAAQASGVLAARQAGSRNEYMPLGEPLQLSAFEWENEPAVLSSWEDRIDRDIANGGTLIINAHQFTTPDQVALFQGVVDYLAAKHVWCPSIDQWWNTKVAQSAAGNAWSGRYVYLACGSAGVKVVDVTDPLHPSIVGTRDTDGSATNVATDDSRICVADGVGGLSVLDASNPAAPTMLGQSFTSGTTKGVAVQGGYAYLAEGAAGLRIVSLANPANPVQAGVCDTPGDADGVALSGNYAYVADGGATIQVINISNPASPTIVGSMSTSGQAQGIEAWGGHAYVAAGSAGLQTAALATP